MLCVVTLFCRYTIPTLLYIIPTHPHTTSWISCGERVNCVFVEEREDRFRLWKESKTRAYIILMKSVKEGYYDDRAKVCC